MKQIGEVVDACHTGLGSQDRHLIGRYDRLHNSPKCKREFDSHLLLKIKNYGKISQQSPQD